MSSKNRPGSRQGLGKQRIERLEDRSLLSGFGPEQVWSPRFVGGAATLFGDVNGDGKDDAVVIKSTTGSVKVKLSTGEFGPGHIWGVLDSPPADSTSPMSTATARTTSCGCSTTEWG